MVFCDGYSKDFCNSYLRSVPEDEGIISLAQFMFFWGLVFIVATLVVWIGKNENDNVKRDPDITQGTTYIVYPLFSAALRIFWL